jgi:hypothetical protein
MDSNYDEALKDSVHENVMEHLHQGLVLPIFYTLCHHPKKRLFTPNVTICITDTKSGTIQLSSEPVKTGTVAKRSWWWFAFHGVVSEKKDLSYIPAFFTTNGMARSIVKDQDYTWTFNEEYTKLVTALVNTPAKRSEKM